MFASAHWVAKGVWNMERDPVCGMEVDPNTAPAKAERDGQTFYFCSSACKDEFERNPMKYAA